MEAYTFCGQVGFQKGEERKIAELPRTSTCSEIFQSENSHSSSGGELRGGGKEGQEMTVMNVPQQGKGSSLTFSNFVVVISIGLTIIQYPL